MGQFSENISKVLLSRLVLSIGGVALGSCAQPAHNLVGAALFSVLLHDCTGKLKKKKNLNLKSSFGLVV